MQARTDMLALAETDLSEFMALVGGAETLAAWAVGKPAGPGTVQVTSLPAYLDLFLQDCTAYYALDGREYQIAGSSPSLVEAIGFLPRVAFLVEEDVCSESRFHLAFYAPWLDRAPEEKLAVVLVPDILTPFVGAMTFQALDFVGAPAGNVTAHMTDLATFRARFDTRGTPSPRETQILIALAGRAYLAGVRLPSIHSTRNYPPWAKSTLTPEQLDLIVHQIVTDK